MVASACLLSFPSKQNYARICFRDPALLSQMLSPSPLPSNTTIVGSSRAPSSSQPTLVEMHLDVGPAVACLCPSEVFWLGLMASQLTALYEAYSADRALKQRSSLGGADAYEEDDDDRDFEVRGPQHQRLPDRGGYGIYQSVGFSIY